jgi:PPOX class probable F420-dependent enzyme
MSLATLRPDGWPQATTVGFAHDGLTLYFLCGPDSQKAANLARDGRVSLTIDHDTPQVMDITGLSMAGHAHRVVDRAEAQRALQLLMQRYPAQQALPGPMPQADDVCVFRVEPEVISVLDYTKGFGHTDLVAAGPSSQLRAAP